MRTSFGGGEVYDQQSSKDTSSWVLDHILVEALSRWCSFKFYRLQLSV